MEEILLALNVSIGDFYSNPQEHLTSVTDGGRTCLAVGENVFSNNDTKNWMYQPIVKH